MEFAVKTGLTMVIAMLLACSEPPPPPTVEELVYDRILLDATMVRCSANRAERKYDPECVNARDAVNRIAREEEKQRREELEAQSERKRQALRRTQEAASMARRRAAEAAKRREEEAYLMQFSGGASGTNVPAAQGGSSEPAADIAPAVPVPADEAAVLPAPETTPPAEQDLQSIRDELKRRQESGN